MATDWFTTTTQQTLYQATAERSVLLVKQAQAQRMQAEYAKIEAKYDGSTAARIEDDINKLGEQKTELATWLSSVNDGLKQFNKVREYMLQAQATLAVETPNPEAFDNYYDALNSNLYSEKFDKNSLISNTTNHRGSWQENTTTVSSGNMSADVSHHYLGNDYVIELDGGAGLMEPNRKGMLTGLGHTITRANLQLVSRDDSGHVEFQDVTDPDNPVTFSGTVKRGGLGVLPAWLYGDLSDPANKDVAKADFKAAFKKLARNELDFNIDSAQLSGIDSSLSAKMKSLQTDYDRAANEETDAKIAEKKAIKARFDLYTNSLALTSTGSTYYIKQMFNTTVGQKKSLTDVLLGAVTG